MAEKEGIYAVRPKVAGCNQKALILGVSARDSSKQWEIRRLSQFFVLGLSSSSTLLYQFLQPAIGGRGHVGDSPRGPLKQRGNPHLKPATTR
jgi:hypothetical protein